MADTESCQVDIQSMLTYMFHKVINPEMGVWETINRTVHLEPDIVQSRGSTNKSAFRHVVSSGILGHHVSVPGM